MGKKHSDGSQATPEVLVFWTHEMVDFADVIMALMGLVNVQSLDIRPRSFMCSLHLINIPDGVRCAISIFGPYRMHPNFSPLSTLFKFVDHV